MRNAKYLLAVDADNMLHRSYYGNPTKDAPMGIRLNGITTFFRSIDKLLRRDYYDHLFTAWDIKSEYLKRADLLTPYGIIYKNREAGLTEEQKVRRAEIHKQKIVCHKLLVAMGIPSVFSDREMGAEADDIIGSVAKKVRLKQVTIVSTDKDMAQLIDSRIKVYHPIKDITIDEFDCEDHYGVGPERIVDFLCMMGDSSDNVPGFSGCGAKTALKLLESYDTVEDVVKNAKFIKGAVGVNLRSGANPVPVDVVRKLITINTKLYKKNDPVLDTESMNLENIKERLKIHENRDAVELIKSQIGFEGLLMPQLGI